MEKKREKRKVQRDNRQIATYLRVVNISFLFSLFSFLSPLAHATTASNDNFQLNIEQYDAAPEVVKKVPTPTREPAQEGNLGVTAIPSAFSFAITEPLIDFGVLSATNPVIRTTNLQVVSPGSGFTIFAFSDHNLLSDNGSSIPDTTCDNGSCSETTDSLWENSLTYGYGYRCDSVTPSACLDLFASDASFRQFSDVSKNEMSRPIMQNAVSGKDKMEAKLTFKINVSGTQPKDTYTNTVTFLAVPNF